MREPTTARLVADLMLEAGMDRIITVHPHVPIHAFFGKIPINSIETVDLFTEEFSAFKGREDVIAVAPDGGALKFVSRFSRALSIKTAVALKERSADGSVSSELVGEMKGKKLPSSPVARSTAAKPYRCWSECLLKCRYRRSSRKATITCAWSARVRLVDFAFPMEFNKGGYCGQHFSIGSIPVAAFFSG
jgi:hypothetical protein